MKPPVERAATAAPAWPGRLFAAAFGAFLGLSLLKFGNPPIFEKWVEHPTNFIEFLVDNPWPIAWAYGLLALVVALALPVLRWRGAGGGWLLALPLAWLGWQWLAASQTLSAALSTPTLVHFCACVACYYLGFFALSHLERSGLFWVMLLGAFMLVMLAGWHQHFGGIEETRRYFLLYIYPRLKEAPPELMKKMASNRIFATMFYPNALAGGLLLLFAPLLGVVCFARKQFTWGARAFLGGCLAVASAGCLFWSGSKGGWLLALVLGLVMILRMPFAKGHKAALITAVLVLGLAGFFVKYARFFEKGATSVGARFDYWRAAAVTAKEKPGLGTGPGTFYLAYQRVKRPESESARLTHNDYLEQASDSGLPGALFYLAWVAGVLCFARPPRLQIERGRESLGSRLRQAFGAQNDYPWLYFLVWLGVLGWALQSFVEFGLYIPGLAWPAFSLMGWLVGRKGIDSRKAVL